ncbi:hypothetical protein SAMN04515647_0923 [Cohaesibacter sp. ES.047]|uniref:YheT family hydrolase n=1 Tax=Cohaesibacter sp. ES.047 TaxID=1798205 RepID=UPI000BB8DCF0|nr:alpha/beta fold hydrolase [Cohaesibacter sp. ES.047]SNY90750.1 hypothetical protein SAMN04515647_0923 [Cohaesibacter sp. ES.047]
MTRRPTFPFSNAHVNTILANHGPRKWLIRHRAKAMNARSHEVLLDCSNGVRLHGVYTPGRDPGKSLITLIHGWEGTAWSIYLQSAAIRLEAEGHSIFRLHLRDHGPTHHLNAEPFLAIRLDEVMEALEQINLRFPHERTYLCGYSLGANFVVRAAAVSGSWSIPLDGALAFSPPIDPEAAARSIRSYSVYNRYFTAKWQKSFRNKMACFEDLRAHEALLQHHDIYAMHEDFIPRFSEHPDAASYFRAYALTAENLSQMDAPCHVVMVRDDPIIPVATSALLPDLDGLTLEVRPYGGHCGFVEGFGVDGWADDLLLDMVEKCA